MATVQYGQLTFKGLSGRTYTVNLVTTDVDGAMVALGPAGNTFWNVPETGYIIDIMNNNGAAGTCKFWTLLLNGVKTEHKWHLSSFISTVQYPRVTSPIGIAVAPQMTKMIQLQESVT